MDEKRTAPRMRRLKEARIIFNGRKSVISCLVRDATETGARVAVGEPYLVPQDFEFAMHGQPVRRARRIWVRQKEMGLSFTP
jgi:hypothetical protein